MDRNTAQTTCQMVGEIIEKLGEVAAYVQESGRNEKTIHAIGVCLAELDTEVLEPIYRKFPDLIPDFKKVV